MKPALFGPKSQIMSRAEWIIVLILALLVATYICLLAPNPVRAAGAVTIAPPFKEVVIAKDQAKSNYELQVTNSTAVVQTYRLTVRDFGALDESGGVAFLGTTGTASENKYGLASWLVLGTDTLTIGPAATVKVAVTVENRQSLAPGGHYGAILLTAQGEPGATATPKVVITQVLSSLVFVKKEGGEQYHLLLNRIDATFSSWRLPSKLKLRFQNTGNVHVVPRGTVEIIDPAGKTIKKGIINSESALILPESFRLYPVLLTKLTSAWLPGKYQMEVKYRFDGQTGFETVHRHFYYLGQAGTITIFLPIMAMLIIIIYITRHRNKRSKLRRGVGKAEVKPKE